MIDVHCHLNFHAFADDFDELIHKAKEKGISKIINVGTKIDSSEKAVDLAQKYEDLYAIVGVHPHHADKIELGIKNYELSKEGVTRVGDSQNLSGTNVMSEAGFGGDERQDPNSWIKKLEELARMPKVVGIGEIGLDYYRYQSNGIADPEMQKQFFESQLELAHKLNLPIQIHNRHAGKDILEILEHHKNLLKTENPGMFHCFAGSPEILKRALDLGFYIGFDGNSTYPGLAPGETTTLTELAKLTPLDRMVTETDSPFLTPIPFRGTRNEPSYVIIVGEFLAKIKEVSFEELDRQTEQNAKKLFNIK